MKRAFTLFEALIAVAMIMLLAGALALFVDDLGTTRSHVVRTTDRTRSADAIFGMIESALQTAVVDGGSHGAGVAGGPSTLRILSSRTDAVGSNARELARAAFAPLVATQVSQSGKSVMVGRAGAASVLPAEIAAIRLRYFDGTQWSDEFDSLQQGRLPVMVEVSVWFALGDELAGDETGEVGEVGDMGDMGNDSGDAASVPAARSSTRATLELPPADRVRRLTVPDASPSDGASDEDTKP